MRKITEEHYGQEITVAIQPDQCPAYYKAIEEGDAYAAHILRMPTIYIDRDQIDISIKMAKTRAEFEEDMRYIQETPDHLQYLIAERGFSKKCKCKREERKPIENRSWLNLFPIRVFPFLS